MVQVFTQKLMGIDRGRLEATLTPILLAHRVATAEVSFQKEPSGWVLRLVIESLSGEPSEGSSLPEAEPGATVESGSPNFDRIDLGLLSEISRDLSAALDVADLISHGYSLEVSSAGLDRPLRTVANYQWAIGKLVKLYLARPAADGQRVLRGRLLEVGPIGPEGPVPVAVEVDGKPIRVVLPDIERGHLIYELPSQPKKKGRPKPSKHQRH